MISRTASSHAELTRMEHGYGEFNVAKMSRTLGHVLAARRTLECAVNAAQLGVVQAPLTWPLALLVHCLGILDVANTHIFCFLRREETELNLLNRLEWRLRVGETWCCRHGCGWIWVPARLALDIIQAVSFLSSRRTSENHACALLVFTLAVCCALCAALPLLPASTPIARRNLREARLLCSCSRSLSPPLRRDSCYYAGDGFDDSDARGALVARYGCRRKMRARRRSRASGQRDADCRGYGLCVRREVIPSIPRRSRRY